MPCPQVTIPKIGLHLVKVRISTGFQTGTGPKDTRTTQRRLALKRSLAALNLLPERDYKIPVTC
jgi:hypothetical protein